MIFGKIHDRIGGSLQQGDTRQVMQSITCPTFPCFPPYFTTNKSQKVSYFFRNCFISLTLLFSPHKTPLPFFIYPPPLTYINKCNSKHSL